MSATRFQGLERLVLLFNRMIYFGLVVIVVGVILGAFLPGAAGPSLIGGALASGGLMTYAGLRGRKRGTASLARLKQDQPG